MRFVVSESVVEFLVLVGSALGSFLFTLVGMATEHSAIQTVLGGEVVLGVWEAWIGAIALVAGLYLLAYREVYPRYQTYRHS